MHVDLGEQCFQVLAGELPLEWASGGAVVVLEAQQAIFEFSPGLKVVGSEDLTLNNREVHLDLVKPTGVYGGMHWDDRGPTSLQAFDAAPSVGTTCVANKKCSFSKLAPSSGRTDMA